MWIAYWRERRPDNWVTRLIGWDHSYTLLALEISECIWLVPGTHEEEDDAGLDEEGTCKHSWVCSGTAYGGDDESYHGEGRCYCEYCGADGDA